MIEIKGEWVDAVLKEMIRVCPDDRDVHLTVLGRAYALGCKLVGTDRETAVANFERLFDAEVLPEERTRQ